MKKIARQPTQFNAILSSVPTRPDKTKLADAEKPKFSGNVSAHVNQIDAKDFHAGSQFNSSDLTVVTAEGRGSGWSTDQVDDESTAGRLVVGRLSNIKNCVQPWNRNARRSARALSKWPDVLYKTDLMNEGMIYRFDEGDKETLQQPCMATVILHELEETKLFSMKSRKLKDNRKTDEDLKQSGFTYKWRRDYEKCMTSTQREISPTTETKVSVAPTVEPKRRSVRRKTVRPEVKVSCAEIQTVWSANDIEEMITNRVEMDACVENLSQLIINCGIRELMAESMIPHINRHHQKLIDTRYSIITDYHLFIGNQLSRQEEAERQMKEHARKQRRELREVESEEASLKAGDFLMKAIEEAKIEFKKMTVHDKEAEKNWVGFDNEIHHRHDVRMAIVDLLDQVIIEQLKKTE